WPTEGKESRLAKPAQNPFSITSDWYKISIVNEGFTKITGHDLSLGNVLSDSIHLFYGGGQPLPIPNNQPQPSFHEIPIKVFDGGDGHFDYSDYLIFFAESAERWRYPADSAPVFLENPYTSTNCYWLAVSGPFPQAGMRMDSIDCSPVGTAGTVITQTRFNSRQESNKFLRYDNQGDISDYFHWYWTDQKNFSFYASLPQAIASESSLVRIHTTGVISALKVNESLATSSPNGSEDYYFSSDDLSASTNKLELSMNGILDFCEIDYPGSLIPSGDILDFTIKTGTLRGEIVVRNQFSNSPYIFELSNPDRPILVTGAALSPDSIIFQKEFSAGRRRFYLCTPARINISASIEKVTIRDLMENPPQADMFIIAPEELIPSLNGYRNYRANKSGINISLISLEDIINQFSYGLYDPTAIRNFLKYAYEHDSLSPPSTVLLVGDGNYDFKNYLKTGAKNLIPPYIHAKDFSASDDNYVYFGNYGLLDGDTSFPGDRGYDMMIARWPIRNLSELNSMINKIELYDSSTDFGSWRTTVTLVADDEFGTVDDESEHTVATEILQKFHLPSVFRRNKIYLWDYPTGSGDTKPAVNAAIVRSINEGTLLINYTGHGNPRTWAHEYVFNRDTDIPQLHNADKLTFVFVASCSIGFFDDPSEEGMAEELIRLRDGGAIATVAATRLVYPGQNAALNQKIFDMLFDKESLSICQAVYISKVLRQYGDPNPPYLLPNDRKYIFFGDPLLKLGVPHYGVKFTNYPDTLLALARHNVAGEIIDIADSSHIDLDGNLDISIYDSEIPRWHVVVENDDTVRYSLTGPMIYRGRAFISHGNFEFSFVAPLDIGLGGKGAKISGYAIVSNADAFGIADSIPVATIIDTSNHDSTGPSIVYIFGDRQNFISGDKIAAGEELKLTLSDSSGINLTGGSGHVITLVIDNRIENIINLTGLFQYGAGSYTTGQMTYETGQLTTGSHIFKIKAWDNANNSSVAEFRAQVVESGRLMITDLLNYPNPMRDRTVFSFALTSPARKVSLEIFTLSGKRIKYFEKYSVPADFNEFYSWYGRDAEGDRVATGVYIYKVTAQSEPFDEIIESYGKVVVIN
ncbi:MAG: type IX secretion system sortase PorU, partial [candidate division Zixibacteria bacterium]|nr:type IX secretion system sortase PorU [candidate division Zixibacteria bacterium]